MTGIAIDATVTGATYAAAAPLPVAAAVSACRAGAWTGSVAAPLPGTGLSAAGLGAAGLDIAGLDIAGLDIAGLDIAGLDIAGLGAAVRRRDLGGHAIAPISERRIATGLSTTGLVGTGLFGTEPTGVNAPKPTTEPMTGTAYGAPVQRTTPGDLPPEDPLS